MNLIGGSHDSAMQKGGLARIRSAEMGNLGDVQGVGEGVSEMRIHYGPGYRVYFTIRDLQLIFCFSVVTNRRRNAISRKRNRYARFREIEQWLH